MPMISIKAETQENDSIQGTEETETDGNGAVKYAPACTQLT